jgi:hypothetical protein
MDHILQLGELTYTLSLNAEKQRALVASITGGGLSDPVVLLDRSLPQLITHISTLNSGGELKIGKLYVMVPDVFEGGLEARGMRWESRYPGVFKKEVRHDGLEYVFIFDRSREIGEHDRAEIVRMVAEVNRQQPRHHDLRDYTIRRGRVEDSSAIASLLSEVFMYYDDFPQGITEQAIASLFKDDFYLCYVCEHHGAVIGYLAAQNSPPQSVLGFETREIVLDTAAVARSERRKGVMTEMVREVKALAQAEDKTWYSYCRVLMDGGRAVPTGMHRSMREAGAEFLGILSYAYTMVTDEDTLRQPRMVHAVTWGA